MLSRRQQRCLENHTKTLVIELHMRPVIRAASVPQDRKVGVDRLRKPKQMHGQVNQVRAQVKPKASAYTRIFAPSMPYRRPIAVHTTLEMHDSAQSALPKDLLQAQNLTIPAPILKHSQETLLLHGQVTQRSCFRE